MQETVLQRRALHLDVVGELEAALEGACGDALIERLAALLVSLGLLVAADRQRVFLDLDRLSSSSPKPATATEMR